MKHHPDMDMSPRAKRPRQSYAEHEEMHRDYADFRREGRAKHRMRETYRDRSPRSEYEYDRVLPRHKDERGLVDPFDPRSAEKPEYRSLCVSGLLPQVPDNVVRDALWREFKKFGEFNVKVTHTPTNERLAYVNFRYPEDAREARNARGKLILFDRPVRVEPVFKHVKTFGNFKSQMPSKRRGSISPEYLPPREPLYMRRSISPAHSIGSGRGMRHDSLGRELLHRDMRDMRDSRSRDFERSYDSRSRQPPQPPVSSKVDKFPHHLDHISPEDDSKATRTLFVGNLDYNITENELRHVFSKYGTLEDVDIKRPPQGHGNAYAFVKFSNLDYAHRAKVQLSGQMIGKFQCKIGYGKVTPTTCLWVGGLGSWIRPEDLAREFDRFGLIHRIDWPQGKNYAYVVYDSIDAAQAASQEMRGFPLGGPDRRLRVDFVEPAHILSQPSPSGRSRDGKDDDFDTISRHSDRDGRVDQRANNFRDHDRNRNGNSDRPYNSRRGGGGNREKEPLYRNQDNQRDNEDNRFRENENRNKRSFDRHSEEQNHYGGKPRTPNSDFWDRDSNKRPSYSPNKRSRFGSEGEIRERDRERERERERSYNKETSAHVSTSEFPTVDHVENILDLMKKLSCAWTGALVLKSSAFPARLYHVSGDVTLADVLMKDASSSDANMLRITQRLRLDQTKLEEVGKRVSGAGSSGYCIFLAVPTSNLMIKDPSIQQRPLRNLVTYLQQKEAAGVVALPPSSQPTEKEAGVLHAFPPCDFGHQYLRKRAPKLGSKPLNEDHLVIVVVKGTV
ncbi:putative RNA-binding protein 15B [Lingula anatina]|uniref:RNA-binding protein 15B n=1 Tax=Lingula anatina TaxID=7574 RepID=A0A1S3IT60_LINAN|nr:putative RNA-binding protein 15B [Lingula anatina]XP_013401123.1 putative RNA-binding protein 15B [Lingula anatina]|eukprot:XP_013401121.1 putative RNA-binding protein 15B [Lingula anatina]